MTNEAPALVALQSLGLSGHRGNLKCPVPGHGVGQSDRSPSLAVNVANDGKVLVMCRAGCETRDVVAALGLSMRDLFPSKETLLHSGAPSSRLPQRRTTATTRDRSEPPLFTADHVSRIWAASYRRARNDHAVPDDQAAYKYLNSRGLTAAWSEDALGVVGHDTPLPPQCSKWHGRGYRIIARLFDCAGNLANVQARRVFPGKPKTLFPKGSRARGTMFATRSGLALLRREWNGPRIAILGEGMTDYLALSFTAPVPVLSAPGAGMAKYAVSDWARDTTVCLALDLDPAGARGRDAARIAVNSAGGSAQWVKWPKHASDACDALSVVGEEALIEFFDRHLPGGGHGSS